MPEVSRFFGIIIAIYYNDHSPPHFHAKYGGKQAAIDIESGAAVKGSLSPRTLRIVEEWRLLHQEELMNDWNLARAKYPLNKIEPLE